MLNSSFLPGESTHHFQVAAGHLVSAVWVHAEAPKALLVLAHGAGAGMSHPFMQALAFSLAAVGITTFRYQFPYMEKGLGRPDHASLLTQTVRAAVLEAQRLAPGLTLFAGGKSMGGRMTSLAASEQRLPEVRGLVFFGFPLHQAKKPGVARSEHLGRVHVPMLFLQGTRDALADLTLLRPVCESLGAKAELSILEGADHSFHVLKRSGRSDEEILQSLGVLTGSWMAPLLD